jgi:hypothetical protein
MDTVEGIKCDGVSGVVIVNSTRRFSGYGIEPSGFSFPNYSYVTTCHFHPYSGDMPFECKAPVNGRTIRSNARVNH